MSKHVLVLFLVSVFSEAFTQVNFEKGYFIDNNDQKTECFIKNRDWLRNPTEFIYKMSLQSERQTIDILEVKEFGVGDSKYIRAFVDIDNSTSDLNTLEMNKNPQWVSDTVLLKVIVEGNASLYHYRKRGGMERFFFKVEDSDIKQLVYKPFRIIDTDVSHNKAFQSRIAYNMTYLNQLRTEVLCSDYNDLKLSALKFEINSLTKYFRDYNVCSGGVPVIENKTHKSIVHLKLTPGIDFSSYKLSNRANKVEKPYPHLSRFRIGAEVELVLPFNKNTWAITIEPTYQSYKYSSSDPKTYSTYKTIDYESIEIPFGLRHYFFIGKNARMFLNGSVVFDLPMHHVGEAKVPGYTGTVTLNAATSALVNGAFGLGFNFKRFSIEGRYYLVRKGSYQTVVLFHDYYKSSVILGYRLF